MNANEHEYGVVISIALRLRLGAARALSGFGLGCLHYTIERNGRSAGKIGRRTQATENDGLCHITKGDGPSYKAGL